MSIFLFSSARREITGAGKWNLCSVACFCHLCPSSYWHKGISFLLKLPHGYPVLVHALGVKFAPVEFHVTFVSVCWYVSLRIPLSLTFVSSLPFIIGYEMSLAFISLAETCSVPWLISCVWMLDFRQEQKNIVLLLLLCYSMHSHSTSVSFVMSMAPNRTSVSQCLQELISFLNTITGSCVLDFSSRGFLKDVFASYL